MGFSSFSEYATAANRFWQLIELIFGGATRRIMCRIQFLILQTPPRFCNSGRNQYFRGWSN